LRAADVSALVTVRSLVPMSFIGFPLLAIPFAIYNMVAFPVLYPRLSWANEVPGGQLHLPSGADWKLISGDLLISFALLILLVEMLKATRLGRRNVLDHVLSIILFGCLLAEFVAIKEAATSTFFLLVVISFVDVVGGFAVSARVARRDLQLAGIAQAKA
jgi:hypothetical protein